MGEARKFAILAQDQSEEQEGSYLGGTEEQRTVQFASLMDICHSNAEFEPKCRKYEGPVVLRGDTVKDDSSSYAVFTELYQDAQDKQPTQYPLTPTSKWRTLQHC